MKKILSLLLLLGLSSVSLLGRAEKLGGACGIVTNPGHAFSMTAPKGWIIDSESGTKFRIGLVFYPVGTEWGKGDVMLYVRTRPKIGAVKTIDQQIEYTLNDYHSHGHPNYKLEEKTTYKLSNGTLATIAKFSGDSWNNHEMIGYFDEENVINFLVLNARNKTAFDTSQNTFFQILDSYRYVTDVSSEYLNQCKEK